ncbi:hypothetical protein [Vibrio phage 33Fb.4]|nr:hypothetical protein [Vibrio phage 31Fb.4]WAG58456.1 hypothetical protein [Vibrio phage 33Fb.4]
MYPPASYPHAAIFSPRHKRAAQSYIMINLYITILPSV